MKNTRCEEVVLQLVVRTYDNAGRPIDEKVTNPVKVFRNAETLDFWGEVDKAVKVLQQQPSKPSEEAAKKKPVIVKKATGK